MLCDVLAERPQSPVRKYTRQEDNAEDIDAVIDVRAVFQQAHRELAIEAMVRPDQHVAQVLPIDGHAQLAAYFDRFMLPRSEAVRASVLPDICFSADDLFFFDLIACVFLLLLFFSEQL
jgi:hypothetical protein